MLEVFSSLFLFERSCKVHRSQVHWELGGNESGQKKKTIPLNGEMRWIWMPPGAENNASATVAAAIAAQADERVSLINGTFCMSNSKRDEKLLVEGESE